MKILICDDDIIFAENLRQLLMRQLPDTTEYCVCQNRAQMIRQEDFDLLLMDICLEEDDGIQLSKSILQKHPHASVIFITGYPDLYYEKVFLSVRPCGFIKKPVDEQLLLSLIRQIIQEKEEPSHDWIVVKTRNGRTKISISQILYAESQKHRLLIHMSSEILETYGKLSDMEAALPDTFFRCHKSFLINARHIKTYEGNRFVLDDGTYVEISQTRRKEIRQKFFRYLEQEQGPYSI